MLKFTSSSESNTYVSPSATFAAVETITYNYNCAKNPFLRNKKEKKITLLVEDRVSIIAIMHVAFVRTRILTNFVCRTMACGVLRRQQKNVKFRRFS